MRNSLRNLSTLALASLAIVASAQSSDKTYAYAAGNASSPTAYANLQMLAYKTSAGDVYGSVTLWIVQGAKRYQVVVNGGTQMRPIAGALNFNGSEFVLNAPATLRWWSGSAWVSASGTLTIDADDNSSLRRANSFSASFTPAGASPATAVSFSGNFGGQVKITNSFYGM